MAVQITCPECGRKLSVSADDLGKRVRCPKCAAPFTAAEGNGEQTGIATAREADSAPEGSRHRDEERSAQRPPRRAPRRGEARSRDEEEGELPREGRRKGSGPLWPLIVGATAAVVAVPVALFALGVFDPEPRGPAPVALLPAGVPAPPPPKRVPVVRPRQDDRVEHVLDVVAPPSKPIPVVRTPRISLSGHKGRISCLAVTADGKSLVSASWDKSIRVWDVSPPKERFTIQAGFVNVYRMALAQKDETVVIPAYKNMSLWSLETRDRLQVWEEFDRDVYGLAVSPDGSVVAVGTSEQVKPGDETLVGAGGGIIDTQERYALCDASTGEVKSRLRGLRESPSGLAFVGGGKRLASLTFRDLSIWDLATGRPVRTVRAHAKGGSWLAGTPDGTTLATAGGHDRTVKLWDASGNALATLTGQTTMVGRLAFSRDGRLLAAATGDLLGDDRESTRDEVRLWDVGKKEAVVAFIGHKGWMTAVAFTADGKTVVTGDLDGVIRFWDIPAPGTVPVADPSGEPAAAATADALDDAMTATKGDLAAAVRNAGGDVRKDADSVVEINLGRSTQRITDAGLRHLKGLSRLKELHLYGDARRPKEITDAGLEALGRLPGLQNLGLGWTKVTDAGIARLPQQFPNLRVVDLLGTAVTDRAVESLGKLSNLEYVSVGRSKITPSGVAALRRRFPKASILDR